jgi:hypothetical protein
LHSLHEARFLSLTEKLFADSSFYADPEQKYPTIEEQIKLARKMARLLTSSNATTDRGQQMFMKRQQLSDKWATESSRHLTSSIQMLAWKIVLYSRSWKVIRLGKFLRFGRKQTKAVV